MDRTTYITLLPNTIQMEIEKDLIRALLSKGNDLSDELTDREINELVQEGMDGRLCDLSDTIDIEKYVREMGMV